MRFALMPLQWWATADGWVDFTSGPTFPELCEIVAGVGFDAVSAGVTPDLEISSYQEALGAAGIDAAPVYFSATLEDPAARAEFVPRAGALARVHAELGLNPASSPWPTAHRDATGRNRFPLAGRFLRQVPP